MNILKKLNMKMERWLNKQVKTDDDYKRLKHEKHLWEMFKKPGDKFHLMGIEYIVLSVRFQKGSLGIIETVLESYYVNKIGSVGIVNFTPDTICVLVSENNKEDLCR